MNDFNSTVTIERVKELLAYDPDIGVFTWRQTRGRGYAGAVAGWVEKEGYRRILVDGRKFKEHRLAWAMVYGEFPAEDLDHINGVRSDNRIANLRLATRSQNAQNLRGPTSINRTGFLGVRKNGNRWNAVITLNKITTYLGCFKTPEAAHQEYLKAKRHMHKFCTI